MSFLTPSQPATRPPSASSTWPPPLNPPRSQHKPSGSWRRWAEVKLNLLRLPHDVVAGDVLLSLQSEGTIVYVKIQKHDRNTTALVVFRPPPARPFWNSKFIPFMPKGAKHPLHVPIELAGPGRAYPLWVGQGPNASLSVTPCSISTLDFGFMIYEHSMVTMAQIQPAVSKVNKNTMGPDMTVVSNPIRKMVEITFSYDLRCMKGQTLRRQPYQLRIPYARLKSVSELQSDEEAALIFSLHSPPELYRQRDAESASKENPLQWKSSENWLRVSFISHPDRREFLRTQPTQLYVKDAIVDLARWTTYRLVSNSRVTYDSKFPILLTSLEENGVKVDRSATLNIVEKGEGYEYVDLGGQIYWDPANHCHTSLELLSGATIHIEFEVRYQLDVCLSHGYINEYNIDRQFLERLASMPTRQARLALEAAAESNRRFWDPNQIFDLERRKQKLSMPAHCVRMRSVTVTPTAIYLNTPTVEISNRIIRQYQEDENRFLRVKFRDENAEGDNKLRSTFGSAYDEIYNRVHWTMKNGISLSGRKYEFLAFGGSQFREHGAFFFCPTTETKVEDMRRFMGQFQDIKVVAKCCSRLGQCFSTTRPVSSGDLEITPIEDVIRNGYIFTDGVGRISKFLLQRAAIGLGLPNAWDRPPSVIQFRLGGCKGVLSMADGLRPTEIQIRRSQQKFPAAHGKLEVIKCSTFCNGSLNRQLILVLSALGVRDEVFLNMMQTELAELDQAMAKDDFALKVLGKQADVNKTTMIMASMIRDGFMRCADPFMLSVLKLWRAWTVKNLKEKARINIARGAFLLGCVDDSGTLKGHFEDPQSTVGTTRGEKLSTLPEIFVQVDQEGRGKCKVIKGICILARNPSLHPGDIRVVHAIDVPELHHLRDVVVFPKTGDRDLGNMCAGGDLDGDEYLVCWDERLIPVEINHPPMDYTPPKPLECDSVTTEDMTNFFVNYIRNDQLGIIARQHLIRADYAPHGVKDLNCLRLAQLHSEAVDYPKTGQAVTLPPELKQKMRPHFLDNRNTRNDLIYHSKRILGQLYDQVKLVDFEPEYRMSFDPRVLDAATCDQNQLDNAAAVKRNYDSDMRRIMEHHGISTEFEVWTAFVLAHNLTKSDYKLAEALGEVTNNLIDDYRKICREKAGEGGLNSFVVAMYTVTAQETTAALHRLEENRGEVSMPLISYPWIFAKQLGEIANRGGCITENIGDDSVYVKSPRVTNAYASTEDIDNGGDKAEGEQENTAGEDQAKGQAQPRVESAAEAEFEGAVGSENKGMALTVFDKLQRLGAHL